ncbi:hypothetical protein GLP30_11030 [Photobacterium phosphoreum]|uniref:Uncharacterized protein n=1 Tax=Photobacterium phosphoreum TaxID=659 RepID=A0AAW4ZXY2_PHOPO|nr:hypothetical protein [Photobacterium phosphoreum]MCD9474068.1 hypothetical protein [Photobacterium phosphoreum]MCD9491354.1 hypothetical protein [Photobacterium phosphoreum]MCD9502393.1 hypothetical protein [Photobacterium phosphoreum]MCD9518164.1 hypothetical protein [Photobacterium phosphoreum]MCF2174456.1 hypothetical protein [Photobacterium phosphoreum]
MASVYRKNHLNQVLALRAHYLPNEDDSLDNLARAIWLDEHYFDRLAMAVNKGAGMLF